MFSKCLSYRLIFLGGISKTIYTRINTHKQSKLVDSYILNNKSVFKSVNKAFWFAMAFLQDRELHEY